MSEDVKLAETLTLSAGSSVEHENLVLDAFDSVCEGDGPLKVALRADQREPDRVRDTGKGIDSTVMPRLSEPVSRPRRPEWGWVSLSFNYRESWRAHLGDSEF
jgi:hypothetical protein